MGDNKRPTSAFAFIFVRGSVSTLMFSGDVLFTGDHIRWIDCLGHFIVAAALIVKARDAVSRSHFVPQSHLLISLPLMSQVLTRVPAGRYWYEALKDIGPEHSLCQERERRREQFVIEGGHPMPQALGTRYSYFETGCQQRVWRSLLL